MVVSFLKLVYFMCFYHLIVCFLLFLGVGIHVGDALNNHSVKMRGRITTIGMCSWGVLNKRENFLGKDVS